MLFYNIICLEFPFPICSQILYIPPLTQIHTLPFPLSLENKLTYDNNDNDDNNDDGEDGKKKLDWDKTSKQEKNSEKRQMKHTHTNNEIYTEDPYKSFGTIIHKQNTCKVERCIDKAL